MSRFVCFTIHRDEIDTQEATRRPSFLTDKSGKKKGIATAPFIKNMSVKMTDLVWDKAPYRSEKLLALLALADWANDEGFCDASTSRLARKARVTKSSMIKILHKLQTDTAIILVEKGGGRGNSSIYKILPQNFRVIASKKGIAGAPFTEQRKGVAGAPFASRKKGAVEALKGVQELPFEGLKGAVEAGAYKELNTHGVCDISQVNLNTHKAGNRSNSQAQKTLSRHPFETILEYTNQQKAEGAKIDPIAVATARERDGKLDGAIDVYLAKIAEQSAAPVAEMPGKLAPELLGRFLAAMRTKMYDQAFDFWIQPIEEMSSSGNTVYFRVPGEAFRLGIPNNYGEIVNEALEEIGLSGFHVEFLI